MIMVLREMGELVRATPAGSATPEEIAAWYERKARLFEQIAADSETTTAEAVRAATISTTARDHARRLRQQHCDASTRAAAA